MKIIEHRNAFDGLKFQLEEESDRVRAVSMEVLHEFEQLKDEIQK
jgi:hypothetical protein